MKVGSASLIPPDTHEYAILEKEIRIIVGDMVAECPAAAPLRRFRE